MGVDRIDVTVIIVSWNAKEYLLNCLKSLHETQGDYTREIIVVDNASTDGSPEAVENRFPEVRLIRNKNNLGFARANNIGIAHGKGRYFAFVNSDILLLKKCLEDLLLFLEKHPEVAMAGPRILNPDRTLQPSCRVFPSFRRALFRALALHLLFPKASFFCGGLMKYWAHDQTRNVDVLSGCFWVVRREAIDEVGPLDEDFYFYGEDVDWCKRFSRADRKVVFYPFAEAIHFGGASSSNAPLRFFIEGLKAGKKYWRKHHGKLGQIYYVSILFCREVFRLFARLVQYPFCGRNGHVVAHKLKRSFVCLQWLLGLRDID